MIALGEPASATTDAMLHYLAGRQEPSGTWSHPGFGAGPPLGNRLDFPPAVAIRALKIWLAGTHQEFASK
jgi:hypothetical protein